MASFLGDGGLFFQRRAELTDTASLPAASLNHSSAMEKTLDAGEVVDNEGSPNKLPFLGSIT
jgi:hypothetical protein